ncbi:MAG: hypothetical protein IMF26_00170 [Candidatus Fermentithermobacillus carboniphilus]|uniref:CN hydrolase domain-containing protein n=1 Tax=Candidatus Fermentithermobacillus carboniphilus TaxID=3085328 RepID=A0AAT9LBT9_9FIRM|nr:MAG: hypothetical protein IMF26_00170 [Candidatus Fermentithermobacillus carboniphilus]
MYKFTQQWLIWGLLSIVVLLPLVKPIGLPVGYAAETEAAFKFIDNLPKGSITMMVCEVAPSNAGEIWPAAIAIARHHLEKGHKVVISTFIPDGIMYSLELGKLLEKEYGAKYGEDYIVLPYVAGRETALAAVADNIRGVYKEDQFKQDLNNLPLWTRIQSIKDFAVVSCYTSSDDTWWLVRHIWGKYQVPCISSTVSVATPDSLTYYKNGQLVGMLGGVRGAAYYEQRLGKPGMATKSMDAQSAGHIYLLVLMLIGNVSYWYSRRSQGRRSEG